MSEKNMVLLEGYTFECSDFVSSDGTTTVTICVSGHGTSARDLSSWVLEVCPNNAQRFDELNILSCEKRRCKGAWVPSIAQKTTYELTGDIGISGALFEEWVGKDIDDPDIEFKVVFDREFAPQACRVAFVAGPTVYQSMEKLKLGTIDDALTSKVWVTPIEKSFCLFLVIPDGYKPVNACKTCVSITKRGLFLTTEDGTFEVEDSETGNIAYSTKTDVQGCVKIVASVPLKSHQACGDTVQATCCDCFAVEDTIGYTGEGQVFEMRDVAICPKKKSFDLTLLNSHCGKSVYRLDGKYIIHCKRCN